MRQLRHCYNRRNNRVHTRNTFALARTSVLCCHLITLPSSVSGSRRLLDAPTAHAVAALAIAAHDSMTSGTKTSKAQAEANRKARASKLNDGGGDAGGVKLSWLLYSGGKLVICNGMHQCPWQRFLSNAAHASRLLVRLEGIHERRLMSDGTLCLSAPYGRRRRGRILMEFERNAR
eukprot:COSAG02_NODE_3277_length_7027_cov_19.864463_8_plen_176_part_00